MLNLFSHLSSSECMIYANYERSPLKSKRPSSKASVILKALTINPYQRHVSRHPQKGDKSVEKEMAKLDQKRACTVCAVCYCYLSKQLFSVPTMCV